MEELRPERPSQIFCNTAPAFAIACFAGIVNLSKKEELKRKKDEGKKRGRRRGVDIAVLCRSFCLGDLIPGLESGL
jgi:hypothetical protein